MGLADEDGRGEGHAALAGGAERRSDQLVQGVFFVRVGHHNAVVFRTHVTLDSLAVFRTLFVDVFSLEIITKSLLEVTELVPH